MALTGTPFMPQAIYNDFHILEGHHAHQFQPFIVIRQADPRDAEARSRHRDRLDEPGRRPARLDSSVVPYGAPMNTRLSIDPPG
jgi:hypothetical protein